mmetsp:Transcript_17341/g.31559  ORF Transcript_17341/g.31559 Transcript_17341/m.31559 type:complete len:294 (+) Transcript_17341:194-1075(+)
MVYIYAYGFVLIPLYSAWFKLRFVFRLIIHPLVVISGEAILREVAAMPSENEPLVKCASMLGFDMFFQLVGRFLVNAQESEMQLVTVVLVGVEEFIMRVTYLPKRRWIRRHVFGLPTISEEQEGRLLGVLAFDNMSSMQSEIAAIIIATSSKLLLYDVRVNFDLGFFVNKRPDVPVELLSMLLALCVEGLGNLLAMAVQRRQGVAHVSVLSGERWRESLLFLVGVACLMTPSALFAFALRDVGWFCEGSWAREASSAGEFCGCWARSEILDAFCCVEPTLGGSNTTLRSHGGS